MEKKVLDRGYDVDIVGKNKKCELSVKARDCVTDKSV